MSAPGRATLHTWDAIAWDRLNPMLERRLVTGERVMLAQIALRDGSVVPEHAHEHEQMAYVMEGKLRFMVGGEEVTVEAGQVLHIPSNVPHGAEAVGDTLTLDVFAPPRTDWLDGSDAYLREANLE